MIETWRKCVEENKIVGATLTDLSKAFNCLPYDLLVAKPEGGGLAILGYLGMCHFPGYIFLLGSDLHNFADNNTVTAVAKAIQDLMNSLEVKASNIIEWMKDNDMITNPNKFKAIVLTKTDHNTAGIGPNSYVVLLPCRPNKKN